MAAAKLGSSENGAELNASGAGGRLVSGAMQNGILALTWLLNVAIADAVAETTWRRSPARGPAIAIAAVYVVVASTTWRRTTWPHRARMAAMALFGLLAATAWLPGGLINGVSIAGISTSSLLCLAMASAVGFAGVVLYRTDPFATPLRLLIAGLSTYGTVAFAYGAFAGVPFSSLLSGESVWRGLPLVLQGAVIGGTILLPLSIVMATVRAGLRRVPRDARARLIQEAAALSAALAIVLAGLPLRESTTSADAKRVLASTLRDRSAVRSASAPDPDTLRALAQSDRESPRDRWDPAYVVSQLGTDPNVLLEWVRDNTFWIPYRGILRGAAGVLMDRQGNSLDRSILLATLLDKAGHTTRVAHRQLTMAEARERLPRVVPAIDAVPVGKPPERDLASLAVEYSLDDSALATTLRAQAETMKPILADLDRRVADQADRLIAAVRPQPFRQAAGDDRALAALGDHWWVQVREHDAWRDLDPAYSAGDSPSPVNADEAVEMSQLEASLWHQIETTVVVERWSKGAVSERQILRVALRPADLVGRSVVLQFWPTALAAPSPMTAAPGAALARAVLDQHQWAAALVVDRNVMAQAIITDGDETGSPANGNPFGALGSGFAGALGQQASRSGDTGAGRELSAAWIEYEIHVPGEPPRTIRRVVFDLIGSGGRAMQPAPMPVLSAKQRLARSLSLMMRTEILPLGCQPAPEFVMHLSARSVLDNAEVLRSLYGPDAAMGFGEMLDRAAPSVSSLYTLALMRLEWSPVGDRVFIGEPNLLTRHRFPVPSGDGIAIRDAIDIVANTVDVDTNADDPFLVRLQQGVFDTNAEALLPMAGRTQANAATAFDASPGWVTVTPNAAAGTGTLQLPSDDLHALAGDLRAGNTVVAPSAPVKTSAEPFVGWWRVDPRTGTTLGVTANGWGQALAESGIHNHLLAEMAQTFVFDYAFCQAVPQVLNQTNMLLHRMEFIPTSLLALPQVKDSTDLYRENTKACLMGAMVTTGITATLPLVMMTLRYRQMARIRTGFCFTAGTLVATPAGAVAIERVRRGDLVLAWDERSGKQTYKPVQRVFVTLARAVLAIRFKGVDGSSDLEVTPEHPFWVDGRGWVSAKDLHRGDRVVTKDSALLETGAVRPQPRETVYNLDVADFHTYFAGSVAVRVHNACAKAAFTDVWIKRSLYRDLQRQAGESSFKKFIAALDKGLVGPVGESGVKKLAVPVRGFTYELKIGGSAARLLGKIDKNGILVLEEFLPQGLH